MGVGRGGSAMYYIVQLYRYPLVNVYSLLLKMAIEIFDLPSYKMVIFHSYVGLPEGNYGIFSLRRWVWSQNLRIETER